jgi:hypothetical protein
MRYGFPTLVAIAGVLLLAGRGPARGELLVNGGFETPTVTSVLEYQTIPPGSEPAGFGWRITSGNVDAVVQGPIYAVQAYQGTQFLDLDGTQPGAISQHFATLSGRSYVLSLAYANNPVRGATIPAHGTARLFDTSSNADLITPLALTHGNSTIQAPNWVASGAIPFVASGTDTTLSFASNDPSTSLGGLFLDAVSVAGPVANAAPEPGSFALAVLGAACVGGMQAWRRRKRRTRG